MSAGLELAHVRVRLGGREVLQGVDLQVPAGRWTCVVGPNGAGKSTLLRAMAGLLPIQGEVRWQGQSMPQRSARAWARQCAWLGQNEEIPSDLRVQDLVMLGRLPHQDWLAWPNRTDQAMVEAALRATQAWDWRARRLGDLSAGERQRVLLARALAVHAPLMLMDEPLVNLDPPHQVDWLEQVQCLLALGTTVVSVLHEIGMALQADALVVMANGRVVHHGAASCIETREAIESVFDHRIRIVPIEGGGWVSVPRL